MFLSESNSGDAWSILIRKPEAQNGREIEHLPTSMNSDRAEVILFMCSPRSADRSWRYRWTAGCLN